MSMAWRVSRGLERIALLSYSYKNENVLVALRPLCGEAAGLVRIRSLDVRCWKEESKEIVCGLVLSFLGRIDIKGCREG